MSTWSSSNNDQVLEWTVVGLHDRAMTKCHGAVPSKMVNGLGVRLSEQVLA